MALREDIRRVINANSAENGSNTPDHVLALYITECLTTFDKAVRARELWYGRNRSSDYFRHQQIESFAPQHPVMPTPIVELVTTPIFQNINTSTSPVFSVSGSNTIASGNPNSINSYYNQCVVQFLDFVVEKKHL